jgi:predicted nucleotidyltransferase
VTADEALVAAIAALDAAGIPYMIVGSLAANFHGIPRSTRDADLVVELNADSLDRLRAALPPDLTLEPQSAFEGVTGTTRYILRLAGSPFVLELFLRSDDAHDRERFERRQRVNMLGRRVCMASAEDMIITKLRWLHDAKRSKDRDDIRNMLAVRGESLDWVYLQRWSSEHETAALLDEIRRSLP